MKAPLLATWFGVSLPFGTFVLHSVEAQQQRLVEARIAWLITRLDSDDDDRLRGWAAEQLIAIGLPALGPVREALGDPSDPAERRHRFQAVVNRLAIYEPGGDWSNGLQLSLRADAD